MNIDEYKINFNDAAEYRKIISQLYKKSDIHGAKCLKKKIARYIIINTIQSKNISDENILKIIKSYSYLKEWDNLFTYMNTLESHSKLLPYILNNYNVLMGKEPNIATTNISSYLQDKNIIILGPKSCKTDQIQDKTTIRFVYKISDFNKKKYANISYYSKENYYKYYKEIIYMLKNEILQYAIVNNFGSKDIQTVPIELSGRIISSLPFLLCFEGLLMGLPRAIYDLVSMKVKSIYCEGIDLYTNFPFYSLEYKHTFKCSKEFLSSWSKHDISFSFEIIKKLNKAFPLCGDDVFKKLLLLETTEYEHILERQVDIMNTMNASK